MRRPASGLSIPASLYLQPKTDAAVLTHAAGGDKIEITGLQGKWTQLRLEKSVIGFISTAPLPAVAAAAAAVPDLAPPPAAAPVASGPGREVDTAAPADNSLPRLLEGKLLSSHRLLGPRAPYAWQLDDSAGSRIAFVDVSKLLLTEQIDQYIGHDIQVSGVVSVVPGAKDIVIAAENLALK